MLWSGFIEALGQTLEHNDTWGGLIDCIVIEFVALRLIFISAVKAYEKAKEKGDETKTAKINIGKNSILEIGAKTSNFISILCSYHQRVKQSHSPLLLLIWAQCRKWSVDGRKDGVCQRLSSMPAHGEKGQVVGRVNFPLQLESRWEAFLSRWAPTVGPNRSADEPQTTEKNRRKFSSLTNSFEDWRFCVCGGRIFFVFFINIFRLNKPASDWYVDV